MGLGISVASITAVLAMSVGAAPWAITVGDPSRAGPPVSDLVGGLIVTHGDQVFHTSDSQFLPGTDNQGWWSPTEDNYSANDNYIVGQHDGDDFRNFFTFDVSSLSGTAVSATLRLSCYRPPFPPNASHIYALSRVETPARELNRNKGTSADIWQDLGDGGYGAHSVTESDCPSHAAALDLPLNDAAVTDINAARHWFSIGGFLTTSPEITEQFLFGRSSGMGIQALVVQTESYERRSMGPAGGAPGAPSRT
ncbi:MAG: hypothetical protein H0W27_03495 [Actinobacteria bacterium]|nr:hypothetical protein [Actinomycetota bacterium]